MTELSDEDIKDAAAEAGISPAELRAALSEQAGASNLPAVPTRGSAAIAVPQSQQGAVVLQARANLPQAPPDAVVNVRRSIESQIGQKGHMQGPDEAAVYDESRGLIYRVRGQEDGRGGALVQVDIDAKPTQATQTGLKIALGGTLAVLGMGGLVFGSFLALGVTAGLGALGFLALAARGRSAKILQGQAHAVASHALIEAEERAPSTPQALPPA
jgi:hypothetical protein